MANTTPPTITLTTDKSLLKAGDKALITMTLSEVATDFVLSDIRFTGGTLSNFSGSGKVYSASYTPYPNWHSPNSVDKYYCQNLNGRNANAKSQIHS